MVKRDSKGRFVAHRLKNPEFFTAGGIVHPMRSFYPGKRGATSMSAKDPYSPTKAHETKGSRKVFGSRSRTPATLAKIERKITELRPKAYDIEKEARDLARRASYGENLTPSQRQGMRKRSRNLENKEGRLKDSIRALEKTAHTLARRRQTRA